MNPVTRILAFTLLVFVAIVVPRPATADVIVMVDESITFTDPPIEIISSNNPFDFLFTFLPTSPLGDGTVELTGLADLGEDGEFFTVTIDGVSFGVVVPTGEDFFASFTIPLLTLASFLTDGEILVQVNFSDEVNLPLTGDFITARLLFDSTVPVPEPATVGFMMAGLASLGLLRRPRRTKV